MESIPNDPSNFGPAEPRYDPEWETCDTCGFPRPHVLHLGTAVGTICDGCLEDLPKCENCGEQGGTPKSWPDTDPDCGYSAMVHGCSLCGGGR